ncbi:hypothetical protein ACFYTS_21120 [Nocardia sp. NPDC004151]|uniref:hypothetical protein n=1 Tax=Nocardia sp. NPDC004151 TaxID=3364304 RepID=UPI0036A5911B
MAPSPDIDVTFAADELVLRLAALAYLARFSAVSRTHARSDLRLYFYWCTDQHLTPLAAARTEVERCTRWMQEVRRFKPATVARRLAVVAGFYRTCVIDGVLDRSPAEYVRRPRVSNESPTLGLSPPQFEALLCAARDSDNPPDFALVAMLGLLGLRYCPPVRPQYYGGRSMRRQHRTTRGVQEGHQRLGAGCTESAVRVAIGS